MEARTSGGWRSPSSGRYATIPGLRPGFDPGQALGQARGQTLLPAIARRRTGVLPDALWRGERYVTCSRHVQIHPFARRRRPRRTWRRSRRAVGCGWMVRATSSASQPISIASALRRKIAVRLLNHQQCECQTKVWGTRKPTGRSDQPKYTARWTSVDWKSRLDQLKRICRSEKAIIEARRCCNCDHRSERHPVPVAAFSRRH